LIHAERTGLADTIEGLTPEQWRTRSLCDLRRPLGLTAPVDADAANACLDMNTKASFPVGGKKRIGGLRLVSTDTGWSYGAGPEVRGPAMSLLLAMTGRPAGMDGLAGDGAPTLGQRLTTHSPVG
jgi:hypothetical protein